jgi:6-pyruvoyltetrahydropterin/6-carboxytetrahydropterin synthase
VTYTISKDHHFSASHQLAGLADDHPCARLHGHNYALRVEVAAQELTGPGFVVDYGLFADYLAWVDKTLDHRHLNDQVEFNPTAENLSRWLQAHAERMIPVPPGAQVTVAVSETPKTWARWSP